MELIDKAALIAEIEKLKAYLQIPNAQLEAIQVCDNVISVINTLKVKEVDFHCDENWDKELALSLQIQAYLNTASDELYAQGKPLYSKSHLEGIHECMKMWVKLHNYYFYKNTCENKRGGLEGRN